MLKETVELAMLLPRHNRAFSESFQTSCREVLVKLLGKHWVSFSDFPIDMHLFLAIISFPCPTHFGMCLRLCRSSHFISVYVKLRVERRFSAN